ncbi:MAG: hypothetical protein ABJG88_09585 [Litorimonas sp.]
MKNVTLYLHLSKKNKLIDENNFIILEEEKYSFRAVKNRLNKLNRLQSKGEKTSPSLLDFWCKSGYTFHIKFGDTMPKSNWKFWDNKNCQFPGMKGFPVAFNNPEISKHGNFDPKNITKAKKDSRKISFKYTGSDGNENNILSCKYDLYVKNICKYGGHTYETEFIIDPGTKNNGQNIP